MTTSPVLSSVRTLREVTMSAPNRSSTESMYIVARSASPSTIGR